MDEEEVLQQELPEQEKAEQTAGETEEKELTVVPDQPEEKAEKKPNALAPYAKVLIGAGIGAVVACLIMWLGFWRVFFVCLMAGIGAFLFGATDKKGLVRKVINRLFPQRR